jgi:uncharacterized protein (TIGR02001 family)
MKIKFLCAAAAVVSAFASTAAFAEDAPEFTITGSAAVVSNYKFRGIAQTDNQPTAQAAITLSHKSGFYIATWGSANTFGGGSEIDVYGGYTKALGSSGVTVDGGVYGYLYPNAPINNIYEIYGSVSKAVGPVTLKAGANWAPKQHYFGGNGYATPIKYSVYKFAEASISVPSMPALTIHSHIGHTAGGLDFPKAYFDYNVGVGYKIKSITVDLSVVGTDLTKKVAGPDIYRMGKAVPLLSLTAAF